MKSVHEHVDDMLFVALTCIWIVVKNGKIYLPYIGSFRVKRSDNGGQKGNYSSPPVAFSIILWALFHNTNCIWVTVARARGTRDVFFEMPINL